MPITDDIKKIQDDKSLFNFAILNRLRTGRVVSKAQLIAAKNEHASQLIAQERLNREAEIAQIQTEQAKADMELEFELKIAVHTLEVAIQKTESLLLEEAAKKGLRTENHQTLIVFESSEKIRVASELEIKNAESRIRLREADELARIERLNEDDASTRRVLEHHQIAQIDVEKDRRIKGNQIEAIVAVQLLGNEKMNQAQDHILNLIRKRDQITQDRSLLPESQRESLEIINESIRKAKEAYNYGESRLLQINSGQELGGFDEDSEL